MKAAFLLICLVSLANGRLDPERTPPPSPPLPPVATGTHQEQDPSGPADAAELFHQEPLSVDDSINVGHHSGEEVPAGNQRSFTTPGTARLVAKPDEAADQRLQQGKRAKRFTYWPIFVPEKQHNIEEIQQRKLKDSKKSSWDSMGAWGKRGVGVRLAKKTHSWDSFGGNWGKRAMDLPQENKWRSLTGTWGKRNNIVDNSRHIVEYDSISSNPDTYSSPLRNKKTKWTALDGNWGRKRASTPQYEYGTLQTPKINWSSYSVYPNMYKKSKWNTLQGTWGKRGGENEQFGKGWNSYGGTWGKRENDQNLKLEDYYQSPFLVQRCQTKECLFQNRIDDLEQFSNLNDNQMDFLQVYPRGDRQWESFSGTWGKRNLNEPTVSEALWNGVDRALLKHKLGQNFRKNQEATQENYAMAYNANPSVIMGKNKRSKVEHINDKQTNFTPVENTPDGSMKDIEKLLPLLSSISEQGVNEENLGNDERVSARTNISQYQPVALEEYKKINCLNGVSCEKISIGEAVANPNKQKIWSVAQQIGTDRNSNQATDFELDNIIPYAGKLLNQRNDRRMTKRKVWEDYGGGWGKRPDWETLNGSWGKRSKS